MNIRDFSKTVELCKYFDIELIKLKTKLTD